MNEDSSLNDFYIKVLLPNTPTLISLLLSSIAILLTIKLFASINTHGLIILFPSKFQKKIAHTYSSPLLSALNQNPLSNPTVQALATACVTSSLLNLLDVDEQSQIVNSLPTSDRQIVEQNVGDFFLPEGTFLHSLLLGRSKSVPAFVPSPSPPPSVVRIGSDLFWSDTDNEPDNIDMPTINLLLPPSTSPSSPSPSHSPLLITDYTQLTSTVASLLLLRLKTTISSNFPSHSSILKPTLAVLALFCVQMVKSVESRRTVAKGLKGTIGVGLFGGAVLGVTSCAVKVWADSTATTTPTTPTPTTTTTTTTTTQGKILSTIKHIKTTINFKPFLLAFVLFIFKERWRIHKLNWRK